MPFPCSFPNAANAQFLFNPSFSRKTMRKIPLAPGCPGFPATPVQQRTVVTRDV